MTLNVGDAVAGTEHDITTPLPAGASECMDRRQGAWCTRYAGHDGQHESAGMHRIESVWL